MPIEGKTETIALDTMILAIGQAVDSSLFDCDKTKKGAIAYDPETFMTSIPGVFAGGDCGNDKIGIAVEAIADAKKASEIIDAYLDGEEVKYEMPYYVTRDDITERTFEDRERECRPEIPILSPEERKNNFSEVIPDGFTPEDAEAEANRCLECGCHDYFECKLIDLAHQYDVEPDRFAGDKSAIEFEDDHPFIVRDPNKCILCGLCVRVCDEVMGIGALGLVNRGFDTVVKPNLEKPLVDSGCVSCGQCVSVCPTGALQERTTMVKEVPVETVVTDTTCAYCSVGCSLKLESYGDMLIKANPDKEGPVNAGLCCGKGKWGFDCAMLEDKLEMPLVKEDGTFREADYYDAIVRIAKACQSLGAKYGKEAIGVSVSDRFTNEEAYAVLRMAEVMGARVFSMNNRQSGLADVLGMDASPNTIDELLSTNYILAIGFNAVDNPVIQLKMKQAAERGAKVALVNPEGFEQHMAYASPVVYAEGLGFLKEIAKALIDAGCGADLNGIDALKESLSGVSVSEEAAAIAADYQAAKKAMIVFNQNLISVDGARLIADIAALSGHIGSPRDGILQVKAKNNSQGLVDLGITDGAEALEGVKALIVFGEEADVDTDALEFLAVCDTHMTGLAAQADIVIPGTGSAVTDGTFTNTERRLQAVVSAIGDDVEFSNWEIAAALAEVFEEDFGWESTDDISDEMDDTVDAYKYAEIGEILGGVLKPEEINLVPAESDVFGDPLPCTDSLMNMIRERLPVAANPTA